MHNGRKPPERSRFFTQTATCGDTNHLSSTGGESGFVRIWVINRDGSPGFRLGQVIPPTDRYQNGLV